MARPDWDNYFMIIADAVSLRMSCDRARIGAVLTSADHRILATGYGGAPSGMPSCDEVGHDLVDINGRKSCVRTVHAEKNALLYAAKHGVAIAGATLYTTASTCIDCALACIQSGVKRIVYAGKYVGARDGGRDVLAMLTSAGVIVEHLDLATALTHWTPPPSTMSVTQSTPTGTMDDEAAVAKLKFLFWRYLNWRQRLKVLVKADSLPSSADRTVPHTMERLAIENARASGKLPDVWDAMMEFLPPDKRQDNPFRIDAEERERERRKNNMRECRNLDCRHEECWTLPKTPEE